MAQSTKLTIDRLIARETNFSMSLAKNTFVRSWFFNSILYLDSSTFKLTMEQITFLATWSKSRPCSLIHRLIFNPSLLVFEYIKNTDFFLNVIFSLMVTKAAASELVLELIAPPRLETFCSIKISSPSLSFLSTK